MVYFTIYPILYQNGIRSRRVNIFKKKTFAGRRENIYHGINDEGEGGLPKLDVQIDGETVWLNQGQLITLFQSSKTNISEHIRNIFEEGELSRRATVRDFRTVQKEGDREVTRDIEYYNLILSMDRKILKNAGKVSHTEAEAQALQEYKKYQIKNLSYVEKDYLSAINTLEKKVTKNATKR